MDIAADVAGLDELVPGDPLDARHVALTGPSEVASSAFDVDRLLASSATFATAAADRLGESRGLPVVDRSIDLEHLLAFCTSHVAIDGEAMPAWADLSGVYPTADDRHLQIHCNFPHHADGVVRRLGCGNDRDSVAAAIRERNAFELEAELIDDGMIAAAVRDLDEWNQHPHAIATRGRPVLSVEQIGEAPPSRDGDGAAGEPLSGLRVLDCSRVLAGPVAGQLLAGFGADVLRVGADHLPAVPVGVMSTGFGKRNTSIDLRTEQGNANFAGLMGGADVWIDAYRPGAFAGHGFSVDQAAELRPGIVVVQICAFDWVGPWAGRRGFDSIVQSTTGVRAAGGEFAAGASGPVGLPVQALDYATGFLAAGLASRLVQHQRAVGGSWCARVSLLRTRDWLVSLGGPHPFDAVPVTADPRFLDTVDSDFGRLTAVRPFAGEWHHPPQRLGSAPPRWSAG